MEVEEEVEVVEVERCARSLCISVWRAGRERQERPQSVTLELDRRPLSQGLGEEVRRGEGRVGELEEW